MKIEYRYVFDKTFEAKKIIQYLDQHNIKYNPEFFLVVEFLSDENYSDNLIKLCDKYNQFIVSLTKTCVFTKEELNKSKWLTIRSVYRLGYPQPSNNFDTNTINNTYTHNDFCSKCPYGLTQIDSFYINKLPKWKSNRHFYQLYWIEDELFMSNYAAKIFKNNSVNGIVYYPVKKYKSNEKLEDVIQIKINNILDKRATHSKKHKKKKMKCNICGSESYILSGEAQLTYQSKVFDDSIDFYKTYGIFGQLVSGRYIIISNKVYKLIIENKLDKNLVFKPIILID